MPSFSRSLLDRLWCRAGLVCLCLFLAFPLRAEVVEDLYDIIVPVQSRDEADRVGAIGKALGLVAAKVSGQRQAASAPGVVQAGTEPGRFVQQFQFIEDPAAPGSLFLSVRFAPLLVDALIRDAGLPVWGRQRPSLLAWVGVDGLQGRQVLSSDDITGAVEVLNQVGRQRGIPMILPLMDLEDQLLVEITDVWQGYGPKIGTASERYAPESVLVARVQAVSAQSWQGEFELVLPGGGQTWRTSATSRDELLGQAMNEAVDRLAGRFAGLAVTSGAREQVMLRVFAVTGLSDYARLTAYLESLDAIDSLRLAGLRGDEASFEVDARGGGAALRQVLQLGARLDALQSSSAATDSGELHFRLRP